MSKESGMTLIEIMVVLATAALVISAAFIYSLPWISRETMRSTAFDVQTYLQLARIEAVSRNRDVRFVIDIDNKQLEVWDGMGTVSIVDDEVLYLTNIASSIEFINPGVGAAVTMAQIGGGNEYQCIFSSDGTVGTGSGGAVIVYGGEEYGRVSVFDAGGIQVEKWNNGAWHVGS